MELRTPELLILRKSELNFEAHAGCTGFRLENCGSRSGIECLQADAVFDDGSQNFRNAPGLSEAAAWAMGWIAVEDFGDMSEAGFGQVTGQRF